MSSAFALHDRRRRSAARVGLDRASRSTTSSAIAGGCRATPRGTPRASRAAALLERLGERRGVALTIRKGLPLSSGLGGSAASAVAAVVAVDALARRAIEHRHAAVVRVRGRTRRRGIGATPTTSRPCDLIGGFVLVRRPESAGCHPAAGSRRPDRGCRSPRARDRNRQARARCSVPPFRSGDAIRQWANVGALVDALHRSDFAQLSRSLEDVIAEPAPHRSCCPVSARSSRRPPMPAPLGLQLLRIRAIAVCALCSGRARRSCRGGDDACGSGPRRPRRRRPTCRRWPFTARASLNAPSCASLTTRGGPRRFVHRRRSSRVWRPTSGLYVPDGIEPWPAEEIARLPRRTLTEIALRCAAAVHARRARSGDARGRRRRGAELSRSRSSRSRSSVVRARAVPRTHAGVQDVGARVMARLMASLHDAGRAADRCWSRPPATPAAAVAHAFHRRAPHAASSSCIPTAGSAPPRRRS